MIASQTEFQFHCTVAQYLDLFLPESAAWFHVTNAPRSRRAGGKQKRMGMKAGVPDICIIYQGRALFIELKAGKGRLSAAQKAMQTKLTMAGAVVFSECRSLDEFIAFIEPTIPMRATPILPPSGFWRGT